MAKYYSVEDMRAFVTEDELAAKVAELDRYYLSTPVAYLNTAAFEDDIPADVLAVFAELASVISVNVETRTRIMQEGREMRVVRETSQTDRETSALQLMASARYSADVAAEKEAADE